MKLQIGSTRRQSWQAHIPVFSVLLLSELVKSKGIDIFRKSTTIHCAKKFSQCSSKVIINWVIFTKSFHHFLKTRFAVQLFPTSCGKLISTFFVEKWRGVITTGKDVKTDHCISVVFLRLNIWHLQYLSSCTSVTIEDQISGIKRCQCHVKISLSPECDLMMTGLLELIAWFACTISLNSASSCVNTRLSMEMTSDIDNRWQYPSVDRYMLVVLSVFNVFLLLSISQSRESLRSWDLFSFSCRKSLVSQILTPLT